MYLKAQLHRSNEMDSFKAVKKTSHSIHAKLDSFFLLISFDSCWLVGPSSAIGWHRATTTMTTSTTTIHIVTVYISMVIRIRSNTVKAIEVHVSTWTTREREKKKNAIEIAIVRAYTYMVAFICYMQAHKTMHSCELFLFRAMGFLLRAICCRPRKIAEKKQQTDRPGAGKIARKFYRFTNEFVLYLF